jgi:hypothetical protein
VTATVGQASRRLLLLLKALRSSEESTALESHAAPVQSESHRRDGGEVSQPH